MNIIIRPYRPTDYPQVKQNLIEGKLFFADWDIKQNLDKKIKRNPRSILVAVDGDKVIGNVYMIEDGWSAFIFRLAVRKEYQNQGIGTKLLQKAEEILKKMGHREVAIFVDEDDKRIKEYYLKRGYFLSGKSRCMRKVVNRYK